VVKLKENENSPNIQIIINNQIYEHKKHFKYIFDVKLHQFAFLKPKHEAFYILYIDTICFDDLMPNNKKPKEIKYVQQPLSKTYKSKEQNYNIDNINELIKKNNDELKRTKNDIYFSNKIEKEEGEEGEEKEGKEKNDISQGGINFLLECLRKGEIKESV